MSTISTGTTLTTAYTVTGDTTGQLVVQTGASSTTALTVDTSQNTTAVGTVTATKLIPSGGSATGNGMYLPAANTVCFSTNGSERVRVDSSGNVGIGVTPASGFLLQTAQSNVGLELFVNSATQGKYLNFRPSLAAGNEYNVSICTYDHSGDSNTDGISINGQDGISFCTGSNTRNERMRVTQGGDLLVYTTNKSGTTGLGFKVDVSTDTNNPAVRTVLQDSSGAVTSYSLYATNAGAYRFYVTSAGVINATSTSITGISDERLKENIRDLDVGLNEILSVKPRRFDWKPNKGQDKKDAVGFIAQEFEQVFPNSVSKSLAGEDGIEYKTLCHEELIPAMVKAIQELKAENDALKTRIEALESK